MKIIDLDIPDRVEHVVFGGEFVPLSDDAIHALAVNAQLLTVGDRTPRGTTASQPAAA